MFQRLSRILMNAADQGGASGNPAAAAPAPAPENTSQAQGDTLTLSKAELETLVSGAVAKAVGDVKGSIFAEARRVFTEGKPSKGKTSDDTAAPTAQNPATPQLDPLKMRSLDFALNKAGIAAELSQSQYERAHRDYASEAPADVEGWVKDYFHGHAKFAAPVQPASTAQPATPAAAAKPIAEQPVSTRGAPPAAKVSMEELHLPTASKADIDAFIKQKGAKVYVETLRRQLKGTPVATRR